VGAIDNAAALSIIDRMENDVGEKDNNNAVDIGNIDCGVINSKNIVVNSTIDGKKFMFVFDKAGHDGQSDVHVFMVSRMQTIVEDTIEDGVIVIGIEKKQPTFVFDEIVGIGDYITVQVCLNNKANNSWDDFIDTCKLVLETKGLQNRNKFVTQIATELLKKQDRYGFSIGIKGDVDVNVGVTAADGMCGIHSFLWLYYATNGTLTIGSRHGGSTLAAVDVTTGDKWGRFSPLLNRTNKIQTGRFLHWLQRLLRHFDILLEIMDILLHILGGSEGLVILFEEFRNFIQLFYPDNKVLDYFLTNGQTISADSCRLYKNDFLKVSEKLNKYITFTYNILKGK
jgi:hypothetical protein